ncbi:MAG: ABC transporter ATP-binding protein [Dehalococcoidia bacterium]
MTAAPPLLSVRGLTASYRTPGGTVRAVRDVSFDLAPGETLALVGESAAGKSTIGLAMLGLLPPNGEAAGDVRYRGEPLLGAPLARLREVRGAEIAMIFQDAQSALTPTISVGDQLAEVYSAHLSLSRKDARQRALDRLREPCADPERVAKAYPFQLSGGMAQRVMIAMATALRPRVIIADEPTASLDAAVRQETLAALERLRDEQGAAVLLITHDFGVVARLADRVAVMYAGSLVETMDVRAAFRAPRHPYTFGLLSSLPAFAEERGRLVPMPGQPPDLTALPPGCPFLPRCAKAVLPCRAEAAPRLEAYGGDEAHSVACFNPIAVALRD